MAKGNQGIRSKNLVHKPVRTGARREHIQKASVAQLGQRQGDHATNKGSSTGYTGVSLVGPKSPISVPLGNEVAANTPRKVGGGREVMKSGSQCMTGPVNPGQPMQPTKPLWPGWEK
jgi:hypothetical protein